MRILVTGVTGLLGSNVARLLVERGDEVRVLARRESDRRPLENLDVQVVQGDVRDAGAVAAAVRGVEAVVHAAAMVRIGWTESDAFRAVNVEGTRNVASAARAEGAKMVHVSTVNALDFGTREKPAGEEDRSPAPVPCPYVVTKREAEELVRREVARGLDAAIVYPGFMLGPWDWKPSSGRILLEVARGASWFAPRGVSTFCDVRRVAEGTVAAVERGAAGRGYILTGPSLSYYEAFCLFADVTGGRKPIMTVRTLGMRGAGFVGDLVGKLRRREPEINSAVARMSRLAKYFTTARAEAELGYRPGDFRDAVETAWKWFRDYGYARQLRLR